MHRSRNEFVKKKKRKLLTVELRQLIEATSLRTRWQQQKDIQPCLAPNNISEQWFYIPIDSRIFSSQTFVDIFFLGAYIVSYAVSNTFNGNRYTVA